MRAVSFACLQIIGQLIAERRRPLSEMPMLQELTSDLLRPLDEMSSAVSEDLLGSILEGLRKRAVASIPASFLTLASPQTESAEELVRNEHLTEVLNSSFSRMAMSKVEQDAIQLVKDIFLYTLMRAMSPNDPISTLPASNASGDHDSVGGACGGISSASIVHGFKTYQGNIKNGFDVNLEDISLDDGTVVSILRSTECERYRTRGAMCSHCRAAQNRWAVRICRHKKSLAGQAIPPARAEPM
jgi:hypothetical protein